MNARTSFARAALALAALACATATHAQSAAPSVTVRADNSLGIARTSETVTVPWAELQRRLGAATAANVRVVDAEGREIPSQVVDDDGDGTLDALIFQGDWSPMESRHFVIQAAAPSRRYAPLVAVRHDPPRDDMAWENDRTAYRIYGEGLKKTSSAMSSNGIDVWMKSTRALIVEKWYAKGHDAYHVDTGEGADFYDVGETLGNGGTAGWARDTIWRGDNFKQWRIIASGPIRATFELRYDPWTVAGSTMSERKIISIDAGQNLYRATSIFTSPNGGNIPYVIGEVKRPGMTATMSRANAWAWLAAWGPVAPKNGGHGELGTAVLLKRDALSDWKESNDHYLAVSHATSGHPVVHYIGSAWTANGDFPTPQSWWHYLDAMAQRIESPIKVTLETR